MAEKTTSGMNASAQSRAKDASRDGWLIVALVLSSLAAGALIVVGLLNQTFSLDPANQPLTLGLAGFVLLCCCLSLAGYLGRRRSGSQLKALEENLKGMADATDMRQAVTQSLAMPVGEDIDSTALGWNRLLGYLERLQEDLETSYAERNIGHLLNSLEARQMMSLFDSLPIGLVLIDVDGKIVLANRACEGSLGLSVSRIVERAYGELLPEGEISELIERLRLGEGIQADNYIDIQASRGRLLADGAPTPDAVEDDAADQSLAEETVLRVTCHRCSQQPGPSEVILVIRDVSQQKLAEATRDDFIAHVSHELRSPLANIRAYAESLLSDMMNDVTAQKEAFNVINEETLRLTRLVNEVLDLSRMEAGTMILDKGEVVMERLIRQSINDLKAMAAKKNITLQTNYHPKFPNLMADRDKLNIVINNVLSNAIKYTPTDGTVFVETNVDDQYAYIKVTDTGYGIPPEDVDKIFDKFYRVNRSEIAGITGTGLGLATCKEIITLHGGNIDVTSELDKGTEMVIKLPMTLNGPVLGPAN